MDSTRFDISGFHTSGAFDVLGQSAATPVPYCRVVTMTTEEWAGRKNLVSQEGALYIYSDYYTDGDGKTHAGLKVGDGKAYVVDLPFVAGDGADAIAEHMADREVHTGVTNEGETLILYHRANG